MTFDGAPLTVAGLAALDGPQLRLAHAGPGIDREVSIPLSIERRSLASALSGGELVMTSGLHLREDWTAWEEFIATLAEEGAAALLLGLGAEAAFARLPEQVLRLAAAHDLPLLSADFADLGDLARAVAAQHARAQQEALRRPLDLQMELTAIVTRGGALDDLLRGWQSRTREPVAVFDRLGRPLARSSTFAPALLGRLAEELADHSGPRLGEQLRLPTSTAEEPESAGSAEGTEDRRVEITPFAGTDTVRGYLARIPSGGEPATLAAPALRSLLALEFERLWHLDEPARRRRVEQFARLLALSEEGGGVRALMRGLGVDVDDLRGIAVEARDETHAEVLVDDLALLLSTPFIRHRGRLVECLAATDPRPALAEIAPGSPTGIGTAVRPQHAARTIRQAALALETSRRVGTPIEYIDGASHQFLIRAAPADYLESFADAALAPIEHARGGETLLHTLHIWLLEGRSVEATAERAGVHRHTVRNRMQRIAQLIGYDPDGIDAQTELWLALKARGHRDTRS